MLPLAAAGSLEDRGDLRKAALPSMHERRHALAVGEIDVGSRIHEEPDDLRVAMGRRRRG